MVINTCQSPTVNVNLSGLAINSTPNYLKMEGIRKPYNQEFMSTVNNWKKRRISNKQIVIDRFESNSLQQMQKTWRKDIPSVEESSSTIQSRSPWTAYFSCKAFRTTAIKRSTISSPFFPMLTLLLNSKSK